MRTLLGLLLVLVSLGCGLAVPTIEHSTDGGATFTHAGHIVGDPLQDSTLTWERTVQEAELAKLQNVAQQDGFYLVRVSGLGKGAFVASVRAACLSDAVEDQAELLLTYGGDLAGFTYALTSCAPHAAHDSCQLLNKDVKVKVVMPAPAPLMLLPDTLLGDFSDIPYESVAGNPNDLGAAKPRAPVPKAAPSKPGEPAAPPPKDDRTWWQKNWLFVVAGGMLVLNMLTKAGGAGGGR